MRTTGSHWPRTAWMPQAIAKSTTAGSLRATSRVLSVTLTSMMFITPTADQQALSAGDGDGHEANQSRDVVELLDDLVGRGLGKIVGRAGRQAPQPAHGGIHFVEAHRRLPDSALAVIMKRSTCG